MFLRIEVTLYLGCEEGDELCDNHGFPASLGSGAQCFKVLLGGFVVSYERCTPVP